MSTGKNDPKANLAKTEPSNGAPGDWPLWEVFMQPPGGGAHEHAGSLHAPDAELALQNARDVYTRRGEAVSIWVVPSVAITASSPSEAGPLFESGNTKPYRHPQFYKVIGVKGF